MGAGGGIGGAFTEILAGDPAVGRLDAFARGPIQVEAAKLRAHHLDLDDEASLDAMAAVLGEGEPLDLVIVATGLLHGPDGFAPEKTWRQLERERLLRSFAVNAVGPALVAKRVLPLLRRDGKAVFAALSARVGSIEDNQLGGWYAYRASKAALNQLLRTLSIELARRAPEAVCVGLHPGTVETNLSAPFRSGVAADKLFEPSFAAARLLSVLDGLTAADTGGLFAWDGQRLPF
ncbi:MAG: SDR family NAD(P)-dependent oxidoreductase [Geminicoccaceae bacterium]|nr:MAG: SDR family NAD(P)-dependent oxidoreductase [Geminicoccaceae bacterium]